MKKVVIISLFGLLGTLSQSLIAGSIRCQGHLFEDGQTNPPHKDEVRAKCGKPDEENANKLIYKRVGEMPLVLYFNDAGKLETIREGSK